RKNTSASTLLTAFPLSRVRLTASSTASSPNKVVNLITGFIATDDVSLNGSPTVSPTTVAACNSVPFCFNSTSIILLRGRPAIGSRQTPVCQVSRINQRRRGSSQLSNICQSTVPYDRSTYLTVLFSTAPRRLLPPRNY